VQRTRLTPRFGQAMSYALFLHGGQERKGSRVPYMAHLLGTAGTVLHFGGSEDEAIGGLLHDAAEDQGGRPILHAIRDEFGDRVAEIVEGCTDTFEDPKPPWRERKRAYVADLPGKPAHVLLVSAADKLDNSRAIVADLRNLAPASRDQYWTRFNGERTGTLWYYAALLEAYRGARSHPYISGVVAAFAEAVANMKELAGTREHPESGGIP